MKVPDTYEHVNINYDGFKMLSPVSTWQLYKRQTNSGISDKYKFLMETIILGKKTNVSESSMLTTPSPVKADFHLTGSDRIETKEDIPLVEIDVTVNLRQFQPMECLLLFQSGRIQWGGNLP